MDQILEILSRNSSPRSLLEIEELYSALIRFPFFDELKSQDESGDLIRECIKSVQLISLLGESSLSPGIYIVLQGNLIILNPDLTSIPRQFRRGLSQLSKNLKVPDEITLISGMFLGEMGKDKHYSVLSREGCSLAMLTDEDYSEILQKSNEILNEKVDFLKELDIFKHWSRLAVKKVSSIFEKRNFRKGNVIYKEHDIATEIFIVSDGEFKFTQRFVLGTDAELEGEHEFGANVWVRKNTLKKSMRTRDLQVVIKQKGDIFGYNEIFQKKGTREFTCTCSSPDGELYVINEKEFSKRLSHPETVRVLEELNQTFNKWSATRLQGLRFLEGYKHKLSHTPKNKIKSRENLIRTHKNIVVVKQCVTPQPTLPAILTKMMSARKSSYSTKKPRDSSFLFFPTEISADKTPKRNRIFNKNS